MGSRHRQGRDRRPVRGRRRHDRAIVHDYANFNWIMTGTDMFACEGTSYGEHQDGEWRAGVTHAGRWCDVFEVSE
jgi:hypothetical protein